MNGQKCTTNLNITRKTNETFTWTIKNIADYVGEFALDRVLSNEFIVLTNGRETKWVMEILPNATDVSLRGRDGKYMKVLIHNKNDEPMKTTLTVSFLNTISEEKETVSHVKTIKENTSFELCQHSWKSLADQNIARYGQLTIICKISIYSTTTSSVGPGPTFTEGSQSLKTKCSSSLLDKGYQTFSKSFSQFHLSKEMTDVQIRCEGQTFDAHQVILAARSPVFRAMFQAEMKEKESRQVEILDLKAKVIPEMLKYIYNGSCCVNDKKPDVEMVSDLLGAADKYQIDILKEMCENVLSGTLVIDNALRLLSLADMHSANDLKRNALDMVVTNAKKITGTKEWKDCARDRPHILIVVAEAMAASNK